MFLIPGPGLGLVHDLVQDLGLVDAAIAHVHAAVATVGRYYGVLSGRCGIGGTDLWFKQSSVWIISWLV